MSGEAFLAWASLWAVPALAVVFLAGVACLAVGARTEHRRMRRIARKPQMPLLGSRRAPTSPSEPRDGSLEG